MWFSEVLLYINLNIGRVSMHTAYTYILVKTRRFYTLHILKLVYFCYRELCIVINVLQHLAIMQYDDIFFFKKTVILKSSLSFLFQFVMPNSE